MSIWADPIRFRRMAAGVAAIAAGVFTFAGIVADPPAEGEGVRDYLASLAANPDLVQLSGPLLWVGFVGTVVMMLAMLHLVRGRGVVLAHVGALLAIPAMITMTGMLVIDMVDLAIVQEVGLEQAMAISDRTEQMSGLILFMLQAPLFLFGFVLLLVAVGRSGVMPWAFSAAVIVGQLGFFVGASVRPIALAATGLLGLAYGWFGVTLLRMDAATWSPVAPSAAPQPVPSRQEPPA